MGYLVSKTKKGKINIGFGSLRYVSPEEVDNYFSSRIGLDEECLSIRKRYYDVPTSPEPIHLICRQDGGHMFTGDNYFIDNETFLAMKQVDTDTHEVAFNPTVKRVICKNPFV